MLRFDNVSYAYGADQEVLRGVSLSVERGERVALLGANGCGKSTLLRLANGILLPRGGSVRVDGTDTRNQGVADLVGFVHQDPAGQFVSSVVEDEVAFGPRNLGLTPQDVASRVASALRQVGLEGYGRRGVHELSGGEQQRLALADVLAMRPRYLVLDEVDSQTDGASRATLRELIGQLVAGGVGVLEVTHVFDEVVAADRVAVLSEGRLRWRGTPTELLQSYRGMELGGLSGDPSARAVAPLVRAGLDVSSGVTAERAVSYARERGLEDGLRRDLSLLLPRRVSGADVKGGQPLGLEYATYDYAAPEELMARGARHALDDVSLTVAPGTLTLLAGASGSGKSTAARVMAGTLVPDSGRAVLGDERVRPGEVGLCFQRPENQLFCDTVAEDVGFGPRNLGVSERGVERRVADALRLLGIEHLAERSPFSLSGGERRRAAIAGVVALRPGAYVFDEPSAGLDGEGRRALHGLISMLVNRGAPVVVVSHDVGEWLAHADQVVMLSGGHVVYAGPATRCAARTSLFEAAGIVAPLVVRMADLLLHGESAETRQTKEEEHE